MTQPTDSLDVVDLKAVSSGGLVREDVLDQIYGKDERETPFLDAIGTGTFDNNYSEWVEETLLTANASNKYSSGTDYAPATTAHGARIGNHAQISRTGVNVTDRAQEIVKVGRSDELGYETARQIMQLRVDQEAILLSNQASVADNPGTTVGTTASFSSYLTTNTSHGGSGAVGGFEGTSTGVTDAITAGDKRDLTWTMIETQVENCFLIGAKPTILLSRPEITKRIGQFLVETKKVQFTANISGTSAETMVSNQYVDTFKTDFGYVMKLVPDLWQPTYTANDTGSVAAVFGIDPRYVQKASLYGTSVTPLARLGDYVRKMVQEDWMLKVLLERAHFGIFDITPSGDVTA